MQKNLAHWCSSDSTQQELSNEYQHDRDEMVFKSLCVLALWAKVSSALEGKLKKNNYVQSNMFQNNALICKNAHMCQTWAYFRFKWIDGMACGIDC